MRPRFEDIDTTSIFVEKLNEGKILEAIEFAKICEAEEEKDRLARHALPRSVWQWENWKPIEVNFNASIIEPELGNPRISHALVRAAAAHDDCRDEIIAFYDYLLAEELIDPSLTDELGNTPLHTAMAFGQLEVAESLLTTGDIAPDLRNNRMLTPLHLAALNTNLDGAKLLIKHGADPTLQSKSGKTAGEIAFFKRDTELSEYLCYQALSFGKPPAATSAHAIEKLSTIGQKPGFAIAT